MKRHSPIIPARPPVMSAALVAYWLAATTGQTNASFLHGETLDSLCDGIAWFALILAPVVGITVFLMVHILPEKIAHKKGHPQTGAIQCLCLLSLVFGGLLWPFAWLWAYTKPVLHKMAYGTDKDGGHDHPEAEIPAADEIDQLRARIAELEARNPGGNV